MTTTYMDRENTNARVCEKANQQIEQEGGDKRIKLFIQIYIYIYRERDCKPKKLMIIFTTP